MRSLIDIIREDILPNCAARVRHVRRTPIEVLASIPHPRQRLAERAARAVRAQAPVQYEMTL